MIYKVYADQALNVLYIEGVDYGPCADYAIERSDDLISIYRKSQAVFMIRNMNFMNIVDGDGIGFTSSMVCYNYLVSLTVASFPLRFTVSYPLTLENGVVGVDEGFLINDIYQTDGGNW